MYKLQKMIMNKKRTVFENKLFKNKNLIYCILKTKTESFGKPKDLLKALRFLGLPSKTSCEFNDLKIKKYS